MLIRCPPGVQERLNLDVEVISGFEEARLIYLGVLQVLPSQPPPHYSLRKGDTGRFMPPNKFCLADSETLPDQGAKQLGAQQVVASAAMAAVC